MSNYNPPTGAPPNWDAKAPSHPPPGSNGQLSRGYVPPLQPNYQQQQGYGQGGYNQGYNQGGYGGYQQGPPQGYQQGPPQGGYYQQQPQQQYYVQQKKSNNNEGCLMGCLAALCMCCALDAIF